MHAEKRGAVILKLPFAGIIQIRFGGYFSPALHRVSTEKAGPLAFAALRQRANYTRFKTRGQMISCRCGLCASAARQQSKAPYFLPQRQLVGSPFHWHTAISAATMATS